jgi:putative MATE family efflux protein
VRVVRPGRHPDDRAILALAIPALGALAADPLYSLADTAFVGRLGTPQLGAVAVGTAAFTASFWLFSFLAYGITPRVARSFGAGDAPAAGRTGLHALGLAIVIGVAVTALGLLFAAPIVEVLGARGDVLRFAEGYLRIRVLAAVPVLIVQVGNGWLRGAQDTRTPFLIMFGGAGLNVVLDYVLIYPAGLGVQGAAWATLIGQSGAAAVFAVVLLRRMEIRRWVWDPAEARALLRVGIHLAVRTGALLAALTLATSVAARMGVVTLASWQIAMQMFLLLALSLDSVAIAAQALVGLRLGAGSAGSAAAVSRRIMTWGLGLGLVLTVMLAAAAGPVAHAFSRDPRVVATTADLLLWLALLQPVAAAAFTFDGILIGASDTGFLAASMIACSVAFIAAALVALVQDWGTAGLAGGMTLWLGARTLTTGMRWWRGVWGLG